MKNEPHCEWLDDYLAGELSGDHEVLFGNHVDECDECRCAIADWRTMSRLLQRATTELISPPPELVQRISDDCTTGRLQPRQNRAARVLFAAVAICLMAGIVWLAFPPKRPKPVTPRQDDSAIVRERSIPAPPARVDLPDDVIGLPIDIGDPNVTVVWIYPTVSSEGESN